MEPSSTTSTSTQEEVVTVSAWLARHAQDPEVLRQQAPTWAALEWLLGSRAEAVALVRREPGLLGLSPSHITLNVDIMRRDLRLSEAELCSSVKKCPQLFLRDYSEEEMQAKFRYIPEVLGRSASLVLAKQPHLYLRSFAGIVCKVSFMQSKGDTFYQQTLSFIAMTSEAFCWHFNYDREEFRAWEAQHFTQARWEAM